MEKKIEFETYISIGAYEVSTLKFDKPSCVNFLSYRKTKVTVELIDEPKDVLIDRLKILLRDTIGYNKRDMIKKEIQKLEQNLINK